LRQINALCASSGIYHITDEAYKYFTYAALGALQVGRDYCRERLGAIAQVRQQMFQE
jgi:aspartate/methionine/tyrosine aminotransferase